MNQLEHMATVIDVALNASKDAEIQRRSEDNEKAREIKYWQGVDEDTHEDEDDE